MITSINEFRKNESNEQRGYVTYEYDLDKKTLTKIDSGVTSEYSMWGTIYDNDYKAVLPFPEDKKDIQKVFKDKKLTLYRLGTSYDTDDIINSINVWLYNNHFIGRGIGRMDENIDTDISLIENSLPSERWSGSWFTDFFATKYNDKIYVGIVVGGKRGYPRDAYIKVLKTSKPALPSGFTYTTGTPVNMYTNTPITLKSIKEDDEYYDDRGYTDSEFDGEVYYEVTKTTNESHTINEGQFSWLTQDTNTQIGSEPQNKISVYMYDNKGNKWHEPDYDGYGEFGGKDYHELMAEMNGYETREDGIDLAYDKIETKNEDGITLFPALVEDSNYNISNHDFTVQPENDPNQGWFMYDDEDDMYSDDMYESKIIYENIDTTTIPKALEDIDERRPNRMKRPSKANYNPWNGRGGEPGMVYIQDEAEEVMQDKYGRERGTRNWEASIGHGARGGAMFKMADDVMKEKQFLFDELNLTPSSYWDYSYFALWKMWMDKIGQSYKIDSDADVQAKKDAKEQAEKEAKRLAREKQQQDNKNKLTTELNNIRDKYSSLNLDKYSPDAKDRKRIEDLINNNRSTSSTLANKMAKSITNKVKAIKRGLAAIEYYENLTDVDTLTYLYAEDVIKPFFDKAMKLNETYAINEGRDAICGTCGEHGYDEDLDRTCSNCGDYNWTQDFEHADMYESKLFTSINEFKQYIKESNNEMLHINLLDKYRESGNDILYREKFDKFKWKIDGFKETHDELDLKIGDIIEFNGGYNDNIRYTTEILGFDSDNDIYLLWESYWYPIKNDNKRNIIKVNNNKINESNNSDYQVYHKQYSSAIDEVKKYANKLGYSIDEDGLAFAYVDGFFKPKEGETKKDSIELFKDDKRMKKQLHVQIYNRSNDEGFELNMYIN